MSRRTARGNRIGLGLVGAVLLVAGVAALLRALDVLPDLLGAADAAVTDPATRDFAAEQGWFWPVLAVALVLLGLVALRWLVVQTRLDLVRVLRLEPDPRRGSTNLPARAATDALEDELTGGGQLRGPNATLRGRPDRPELYLTGTLALTADPEAVREQLDQALRRHRQALEAEHLPATISLRA